MAEQVVGESLAERYARAADEGLQPRRVDLVLRALDVAIAALSLLVLSPALVLIALAIRRTAGGPVLYRGARVGRAGRLFTILKFRTLRPDAESRLGPYLGEELTRRTEAELTRLGRWLRAAELDEAAQLWNVLRGEMSMAGPRPIRPVVFEALVEEMPQSWERLVVRPGLSGLAQTRMGREPSWAEKLDHDLEYIGARSVGVYLGVVATTAWRVLTHTWQANEGGRGQLK